MFIELLNSEEGTSGHTEKGKKGERKIHSFREFPKFVCLYVFFLAFFLVSSFFQRLGFYRNIFIFPAFAEIASSSLHLRVHFDLGFRPHTSVI
ncbi:hypothetical protein QN277_008465 [Acacia crassicarpa]|uniref:Uncharacterized protein n=1 Tax=Acacia crassicarpa TaxID=499986 RepID=A0AAE1ITF7_9FABA|nr:hypothetical protein QN277_008465 [Acacia crassicarpa]